MKKIITVVICLLTGTVLGRAAVASNTVEIVYNGNTATVTVAANISSYITNQSNGSSHVKLVQSASVSDATGEITYILSGSTTDGEFYLDGSYKTTIELNGVTITNPSGPALNIQDGKRVKVKLTEGKTSTLSDGVNDDYNGCLHCKGHTEFRGKGTLNVTGNSRHAIYSKEYIQLKNATINISNAVKDGIHCKEYLYMESGTVNITKAGDDGIQVEFNSGSTTTGTTIEHEDENSGNFYQDAGTLNIKGYNGKAIKTDGTITYKGGTRNFSDADTQTTAVATITSSPSSETGTAYDLQGRKTNATRPGLYIFKNGNTTIKRIVR